MKYLLLICVDPSIEPEEEPGEIEAWLERLGDSRLIGNALRGPSAASTVRVRRRERLVTDGPFAETKEQLGGYYLIEAENVDEAIEIAARIPSARYGTIEVRPVAPMGAEAASV
jgi:hypothetical protein